MAGLITVAELLARPGFENLDSVQAQALIDDASAVVRLAARGALDAVESPDAPPYIVKVMVTLVRRGGTNPMGHQSESLGDYAYTAGISGGGVPTMELTAREKRNVRHAVGVLGVGTITLQGDLPEQLSDRFYGTGTEGPAGS
jgi:hypothetical protein